MPPTVPGHESGFLRVTLTDGRIAYVAVCDKCLEYPGALTFCHEYTFTWNKEVSAAGGRFTGGKRVLCPWCVAEQDYKPLHENHTWWTRRPADPTLAAIFALYPGTWPVFVQAPNLRIPPCSEGGRTVCGLQRAAPGLSPASFAWPQAHPGLCPASSPTNQQPPPAPMAPPPAERQEPPPPPSLHELAKLLQRAPERPTSPALGLRLGASSGASPSGGPPGLRPSSADRTTEDVRPYGIAGQDVRPYGIAGPQKVTPNKVPPQKRPGSADRSEDVRLLWGAIAELQAQVGELRVWKRSVTAAAARPV